MIGLHIKRFRHRHPRKLFIGLPVVAAIAILGIFVAGLGIQNAKADGIDSNWIFGDGAWLNFKPNATVNPESSGSATAEGVTVVSGTDGRLKFWANGYCVFYRDGDSTRRVRNGSSDLVLYGQATATQTVASFPLTNADGSYETRYGIVTNTSASVSSGERNPATAQGGDCRARADTGGTGGPGRLYLTIIKQVAGGGWVVDGSPNKPLGSGNYASEALTAVPAAGGVGYWVYTNTPNMSNGSFQSVRFFVDNNGSPGGPQIQNFPIAATGTDMRTCTYYENPANSVAARTIAFGSLRPNRDYTKLAAVVGNGACTSRGSIGTNRYRAQAKVLVLHLNRADGSLALSRSTYIHRNALSESKSAGPGSNVGPWESNSGYFGDFTADGKYLYISVIYPFSLYRYDVNSTSGPQVLVNPIYRRADSFYYRGGAVMRGPDQQMYVADFGQSSIRRIANPSGSLGVFGSGITALPAVPLGGGGKMSRWGLPQMVTAPTEVTEMQYALTPYISLPIGQTSIEQGQTSLGPIRGSVTNSGPGSSSDSTRSYVVRFVQRSGQPAISAGNRDGYSGNMCQLVQSVRGSNDGCRSFDGRTGAVPASTAGINVWLGTDNNLSELNLNIGDSVCYFTIVSNYLRERGNNDYRYSTATCAPVTKKPKVQFWGGDIRSNGIVSTSITSRDSMLYGSWVEYAAIASGIARTASGAGASSGPMGRPDAGVTARNRLTFANTTVPMGNFGTIGAVQDPRAYFPDSGEAIPGAALNMDGITGKRSFRGGNISISGGTIARGTSVTVRASGTVTITGDLRYDDAPIGSAAEVPQLVIIANNIVIAANVEQVDAWLIANNYISTCNSVVSPASWLANIQPCDRQLRIQGPMIADRLYLRRTFGATSENPGLPAETINLRPESYLWGYARSRDSGAIRTTHLRELPPRF